MSIKNSYNGMHSVRSARGDKFLNASCALMALTAMQMYFAQCGLLCVSHVSIPNGSINLTVHFSDEPLPILPAGYGFTVREISSHWYYSCVTRESSKVRTADYYFEF